MTPERERLVRAVEEAALEENYAFEVLYAAGKRHEQAEIVVSATRAALRAYDAAHPEEVK